MIDNPLIQIARSEDIASYRRSVEALNRPPERPLRWRLWCGIALTLAVVSVGTYVAAAAIIGEVGDRPVVARVVRT